MGTLRRVRYEVEVTFGELSIHPFDPEEIAEHIEEALLDARGFDVEVAVVKDEVVG